MPKAQKFSLGDIVRPAAWFQTPAGQAVLAKAFGEGARLKCGCQSPGVSMYIGRRGKTYYLARMPGTGFLHAEDCPSALTGDDLLSGVGHYSPLAVKVLDSEEYVLNHVPKTPPYQGGDKVSIEGLLDFVLKLSDLNEWHGGSVTFRSWRDARGMLVSGAGHLRLFDGSALFDHLLIPYPFEQNMAEEQQAKAYRFLASDAGYRYVLSPVKKILKSPYGWGIVLKHMAGLSFWFNDRAGAEWSTYHTMSLNDAPERLLCLALVRPTGKDKRAFSVHDLALRRLDARMMPSAGPIADDITDLFALEHRVFAKPLRFDAPQSAPLADYVLRDDVSRPVLITVQEDQAESVSARVLLANQLSHANAPVAVFNGRDWRSLPAPPNNSLGGHHS